MGVQRLLRLGFAWLCLTSFPANAPLVSWLVSGPGSQEPHQRITTQKCMDLLFERSLIFPKVNLITYKDRRWWGFWVFFGFVSED